MAEVGILPDRGVELICGEIIEMSPIGSKHAAVVDRLNRLLSRQLGDEWIVRIQNPIAIGEFSEPEPDVAVVKFRAGFYEDGHPQGGDVALLIEIGDSSLAYDREVKLPVYAQSGVPECWLVEVEKKEIQAYWGPAGDTYRFSHLVRKGETLQARHLPFEAAVDAVTG
jgi:Uma2 family endonuclease